MSTSIPDRRLLAAAMVLALASPHGAFAEGDSEGRRLASAGSVEHGVPACGSCHGLQGQGVASQGGPRLAHLDEDYLSTQLDAFASGARQSPVMGPIATRLTSEQRARVAAWFAGLPARAEASATSPADRRGRELALEGDWEASAPPCESCHGPGGAGVGATAPPLAGQTRAYLFSQLLKFRRNERRSESLGLMNGVATRLSTADLQAAASYFASLPFPGAEP